MLSAFVRQTVSAVLGTGHNVAVVNNAKTLIPCVRSLHSSPNPNQGTQNSAERFAPSSRNPSSRYAEGSSKFWQILGDQSKQAKELTEQEAEARWREREISIVRNLRRPNRAYSGRSVALERHEVAYAFTKLRRILTANNVVRELRLTERHEKKGDKRRRLKSERWRRRFAHEVRKKVQLANEIRARGS